MRRNANEHKPKALDGLLTGVAAETYENEQILQPAEMLHQLQRVLELSLPYKEHQAELLSEAEYCYG